MPETKTVTVTIPDKVGDAPTVTLTDSKSALRRIGIATVIAVLAAGGQIVAEALPHITEAAVPFIPASWVWLVPAVKIGSASLAAWLLKTSMKKHKDAVATALELPPPSSDSPEKYYQQ